MLSRRIRSSQIAFASAALLLLLATGQGSASFGSLGHGSASLDGQLLMLHADDFRHGHDANTEALRTDRGTLVKVDLSQVGDYPIALAGKRVHLTGEHRGDVFVAADAALVSGPSATQTATSGTSTAAATATPTTHKTAVILLNFTNDQRQPWTPSQVADVMFGPTNSVNAYYQESSYGNVSFTGTVFGWVTVPYDNSGCDSWDWGQAAQLAAGINPNDYTNIVYIWPQASSCFWGGMANIGGQYSWINGWLAVLPLAHELGHNLGVQHAGSLECSENGVRVTISAPSNC